MENSQTNYQEVNPVIHWLMFFSLIIIFLTLLISWFIWFFLYQTEIEAILINFSFTKFTIIALSFSSISLILALSLFFVNQKNIYNNVFSLLSFLLALIILLFFFFFHYKFKINEFLFIFLPWIITIVSSNVLVISTSINLITTNNNLNDSEEERNSAMLINEDKNFLKNTQQLQDKTLINDETKEINIITKDLISDYITNKYQEKNEFLSLTRSFNGLTISKKDTKINKLPNRNSNHNNLELPEVKWSKEQIEAVWEKAEIIPGVNKDLYRKDYAGAWMFFSAFIDKINETIHDVRNYGWTIVNHKPLSQNGTNDLENLQPMNIINALAKGENYPKWRTKISSRGNENIIKEQIWSD